MIKAVKFNTCLGTKIEDLKRELLKIGPNWEFNTECPVHKIPLYARGYGHAIADWGKHWRKGEALLFPEGTDIPIAIGYNLVDKAGDLVSRILSFSQEYESVQRKNSETRAELTHKLGKFRPERLEKRRKLKQDALDHKMSLVPVEGLRWLADYINMTFSTPEKGFQKPRAITNCLRCAAGDYLNIDILIPHVYGKKIFIFLREFTPAELVIVNEWRSRNSSRVYFYIPDAKSKTRLQLAAEIESRIDLIRAEAVAK